MSFEMDKFRLDGKVALVTGAVYGIGFEIAKSLAKAGATIVFNNLDQKSVDQGLANYEKEGIKAHGYVCDVTDEEAVKKMVAQIKEEVGVIDILVNNAGIIKRIPMDSEEAVLQMNMLGHNFFIFEDAETNGISIVYRRKDGKYGLIETN